MEALSHRETVVGARAALDGLTDALEERIVNAKHSYR
jgi:hypothetical protein